MHLPIHSSNSTTTFLFCNISLTVLRWKIFSVLFGGQRSPQAHYWSELCGQCRFAFRKHVSGLFPDWAPHKAFRVHVGLMLDKTWKQNQMQDHVKHVAVAFTVVEFCMVHLSEDSAPQCAVFNSHRGFRGTSNPWRLNKKKCWFMIYIIAISEWNSFKVHK